MTGSHGRDRGDEENVKVRIVDDTEITLLLEQFLLLYGQGKLHDAVQVLETALDFMERKISQRKVGNGIMKARSSGLPDDWSSPRSEEDDWAIARVMNDLGCTLQQVH